MYSIYPRNIRPQGLVGVTIDLPYLGGTRDYIPETGTLVVMLGLKEQGNFIAPIGVGEIQGTKVFSSSKLPFSNLDQIGFAFVSPSKQETLRRFVSGEVSMRQLELELTK